MRRIHLERIEVRHLHGRGFHDLKLDRLSPGLTAVYGPNAAGKTVLAQGASRLFSTDVKGDRYDQIVGSLSIDGVATPIQLGDRVGPPTWPQSIRPDLYRLSIPDLLKGPDDRDNDQIRQALAGGLDLNRIAAPGPGRVPRQELTNSIATLQQKRGAAEELQRQESELPAKRMKLSEAKRAGDDLKLINRWLEAAEHDGQATHLQEEIEKLQTDHPGIEKQNENALEELRQLSDEYQSARKRLGEARWALRAFGARRARVELQAVDDARLQNLEAQFNHLAGQLTQAENQLQQSLNGARRAQEELDAHAPQIGAAPIPLAPADRQKLGELVRAVLRTTDRVHGVNGQFDASRQALDRAKTAYRNAGGDPENHPAAAPNGDSVQEIVGFDTRVSDARGAADHAQADYDRARRELEQASAGLEIQVPARDVIQLLQQPPEIAVLMDNARELVERKKAFRLVAQRFEQDVQRKRVRGEEAKGAAAAFRDWLRATPRRMTVKRPISAIALSFTFAGVCVAVTFALNPWAGVLVGTVGLLVAAVVLLLHAPVIVSPEDRRPEIAARVTEGWRPSDWSIEAVVAEYEKAVEAVQEVAAAERAARDAATSASGLDDRAAQASLDHRRAVFRAATGLDAPDGYDLAGLVSRVVRLEAAGAEFAARQQATTDAERRLGELRQQRSQAIGDIGAPVETGASARVWADALRTLISAEAAHQANDTTTVNAKVALDKARAALTAFFTSFGWPPDGDPQTAKTGFDRWFDLAQRLKDAQGATARAEAQVSRLKLAIAATHEETASLFKKYGFSPPEKPIESAMPFRTWFTQTHSLNQARDSARNSQRRLRGRLDDNGVPPGRRLAERIDIARDRHQSAEIWQRKSQDTRRLHAQADALRGTPGWEEVFSRRGLGNQPTARQLEGARDDLIAAANSVESLQKQLTETETRLTQTTEANDLEAAQKALDKAVSQVDAWLDKMLNKKATDAVIQWITQTHRSEARPRLTDRANSWLGKFTGRRYGDLSANGQVYVRDHVEGTQKNVDQLSTGTKAHLALAVRLAVIEESETDTRFPLFLDEVLATSDPDASAAIARALGEIAQQRQVVVLTNQPDDLNVLRDALGEQLSEVVLSAAEPPVYAPAAATPEGTRAKHEQSKNGLPIAAAIAQWQPGLIAELIPQLNQNARTVNEALGQLKDEQRRTIESVVDALEAIRSAVAGAHRRLQWSEIEPLSWTEGGFRDQVHQILNDCQGRPREFQEGFCGVVRMRRDKKEACEQWLSDEGYLVDPPSLSALVETAFAHLPMDLPNRRLTAQGLAATFAAYASS